MCSDCFLHTSIDYNSLPHSKDFQFGLLPVQSPLLRQSLLISFPVLNDMLKLGTLSCLFQVLISKEFFSEPSHLFLTKSLPSEMGDYFDSWSCKAQYLMKELKFNHIKICIFVDTETHIAWLLGQTAGCVRKSNDSRSAIHIAYRSSLRSSSIREPRYPPLKIFFFFWF